MITYCRCLKRNPLEPERGNPDRSCSHLSSAAGDTNDNKTPVGPEDVSKMGCPCLGEHTKLEVVIEESYEFKVIHNEQETHTHTRFTDTQMGSNRINHNLRGLNAHRSWFFHWARAWSCGLSWM